MTSCRYRYPMTGRRYLVKRDILGGSQLLLSLGMKMSLLVSFIFVAPLFFINVNAQNGTIPPTFASGISPGGGSSSNGTSTAASNGTGTMAPSASGSMASSGSGSMLGNFSTMNFTTKFSLCPGESATIECNAGATDQFSNVCDFIYNDYEHWNESYGSVVLNLKDTTHLTGCRVSPGEACRVGCNYPCTCQQPNGNPCVCPTTASNGTIIATTTAPSLTGSGVGGSGKNITGGAASPSSADGGSSPSGSKSKPTATSGLPLSLRPFQIIVTMTMAMMITAATLQ